MEVWRGVHQAIGNNEEGMSLSRHIESKQNLGGALLLATLVIASVAAAVWANLWKADLRVAEVHVDGNAILTQKEILALADISAGQRLYSVNLLAAQKRVMQNAFVKSAAVSREAPDRISIKVIERVPIAAAVLDKIEYLDADGVVLPPARSENIFDLPVVTGDFQSADFVPGKPIGRADVIEALESLSAARQLSDDLYRRISEVHTEPGKDIILYTAESGVPVIFGHGSSASKLVKFEGFWKEVVRHYGAAELNYVDLRFEDQVVVRWNHNPEEPDVARPVADKNVQK